MPETFSFTQLPVIYVLAVFIIGLGFSIHDFYKSSKDTFKHATLTESNWFDFAVFTWILVVLLFGTQEIAYTFYQSLQLKGVDAQWEEIVLGLCTQLSILLFIVVSIKFFPNLWGSTPVNREDKKSTLSAMGWGVYSYFAAIPLVWLISFAWNGLLILLEDRGIAPSTSPQSLVGLFSESSSLAFKGVVIFFTIIIAPVTEEFIFRAGIYRFLKSQWSKTAALVLSSLLFAFIHYSLIAFLPLFLLGLLLVRSYERSGNILTPIIFHGLFNLNTLALILLGN